MKDKNLVDGNIVVGYLSGMALTLIAYIMVSQSVNMSLVLLTLVISMMLLFVVLVDNDLLRKKIN